MSGYVHCSYIEGSISACRSSRPEDGALSSRENGLLLERSAVQGTVEAVADNIRRTAWREGNYSLACTVGDHDFTGSTWPVAVIDPRVDLGRIVGFGILRHVVR